MPNWVISILAELQAGILILLMAESRCFLVGKTAMPDFPDMAARLIKRDLLFELVRDNSLQPNHMRLYLFCIGL